MSSIVYLEKVDNGKPVRNVLLYVVYTEVKPLGMFVGIQVITKPQFIVIFITATNTSYNMAIFFLNFFFFFGGGVKTHTHKKNRGQ